MLVGQSEWNALTPSENQIKGEMIFGFRAHLFCRNGYTNVWITSKYGTHNSLLYTYKQGLCHVFVYTDSLELVKVSFKSHFILFLKVFYEHNLTILSIVILFKIWNTLHNQYTNSK